MISKSLHIKFVIILPVIWVIFALYPVYGQPNPSEALLRSVLLPGWGHHYVDKTDWTRGKIHLATEAVLIASLFGLHARTENLENQYMTLARLQASVNIADRERYFQLAVGDFNSLEEYNDYQLRTRNWNQLLDDDPINRWSWKSEDSRNEYRGLRTKVDRTKRQIPAVISLLIVNRVVSGVSAWLSAREKANLPNLAISPVQTVHSPGGYIATVSFQF